MRTPFPGFFAAFAISATSLAMSFSSYVSAASTDNALVKANACKTNPHIEPSLQICAVERDGATIYRMDTTDGTHVEFVISNDGVALQQSGPDVVQVRFAHAGIDHDTAIVQGVSRTVYRDGLIAVNEVHSGQQPPAWVISTSLQRARWKLGMGGCSPGQECAEGILQQPLVSGTTGDVQQGRAQICNRQDCGGVDVLK